MYTYVAIVKYTSGAVHGDIIKAGSRGEAWKKLLPHQRDGECVSSIEMSEVVGPTIK